MLKNVGLGRLVLPEDLVDEPSKTVECHCDDSTGSTSVDDSERLTCSKCNEFFWDEANLTEHREKHALGLICSSCGYEGSSKSCMILHSRAHLNRESIQCLICKERLPEEGAFDLHIYEHAQKLSSCPWCPYVNGGASDLKKHIDQHLKTFIVNCNFCKYFTFNEDEVRSHSEIHQTEEGRKGSRFAERKKGVSKAIEHPILEEPDPSALLARAVFRCGLCGARQPGDVEAHLASHIHPGFAYCPHCFFRTDDREEIIAHVLKHLVPRPST